MVHKGTVFDFYTKEFGVEVQTEQDVSKFKFMLDKLSTSEYKPILTDNNFGSYLHYSKGFDYMGFKDGKFIRSDDPDVFIIIFSIDIFRDKINELIEYDERNAKKFPEVGTFEGTYEELYIIGDYLYKEGKSIAELPIPSLPKKISWSSRSYWYRAEVNGKSLSKELLSKFINFKSLKDEVHRENHSVKGRTKSKRESIQKRRGSNPIAGRYTCMQKNKSASRKSTGRIKGSIRLGKFSDS